MILNPSHDITLKGLPSEILDAYVRYKKGSRAIVSWLVQYGPAKYQGVKTLPIKELVSLAKQVTNLIHELPDVIDFHFKETIAARKRLSQFFKKSVDQVEDDADTVNHEHFTASLSKIYANLCEHCQKRSKKQQQVTCVSYQAKLPSSIQNHYACLPIEDSFENLVVEAGHDACDECQHDIAYQCPDSHTEIDIENDDMSIAIETASILEQIQETITAAESSWTDAGEGKAHSVAATGSTNIAWARLRDLENQLRNNDEDLSLDVIHRRCCLFTGEAQDSNNAISKVHALLKSLTEADRAVSHYANCHKLTVISHCPSCVQKPGDYIQEALATGTEPKPSFCAALMDNILHLMCGARPGTIVLNGSPVFAEIGYRLTHQDDTTTLFRCVLGIHLLASTYRAYMFALPKPTAIASCRIAALKFSKQASSSIDLLIGDKDSFPCRCTQTLAFHLVNLKDDMDIYAKYRCWDLYFQSPWIAGNHIIEMLDMLSYYGMRLFHYRHYIGAVLHCYNVLTQLGGLKQIPILDYLCATFTDVLFPSGQPACHFKNNWARHIGARLKFKKGHKRHDSDKDSWCMAVPAHAARDAAGLSSNTYKGSNTCQHIDPKFDYARFDPMMKFKQQGWRVDLCTDTRFNATRRRTSSTTSTSPRSTTSPSASPPLLSLSPTPSHPSTTSTFTSSPLENSPLHVLHQTITPLIPLQPQPNPPTTTTTLNLLQIFHATTRAIATITAKSHPQAENKIEEPTKNCICFVHTLLAGADRIVQGRKFGGVEAWSKHERGLVKIVGDALREEFEGGEKSWSWDL